MNKVEKDLINKAVRHVHLAYAKPNFHFWRWIEALSGVAPLWYFVIC